VAIRIYLKTEGNSRHPWIFRKMVKHPKGRVSPGSLVEVYSREGNFIGRGFYHPARILSIRILTFNPKEPINEEFFRNRLSAAKVLREQVLRIPEVSDSYRLVHGEADGLSGLVVDKYSNVLIVEPLSAGYLPFADTIVETLKNLYPGSQVVFRPDEKIEQQEGVDFTSLRRRFPPPRTVRIRENKLAMEISLETGHKTGYFLDQRENRLSVSQLSEGKEVWDLFCYTGGFGISAALGGASKVISVDLDEKALTTARRNADINGVTVEYVHEDCFDFLRNREREGRQADLIIVDPAKLAAVREEIPRALKTYSDINRLAIDRLRPNGILVSCSCSGLIGEPQFLSVLANAARESGAELQMFRITGAAPDHPIRTDFPEGRYLKAVFARVLK
jgi:23S rRNA (cytosine1962-C5)-methyltransferase